MAFNWTSGRFSDMMVLQIDHVSWAKPKNLIIDDTPIDLIWEDNTSQSIPLPLVGEYWVRKSQGRDGGYAVRTSDAFLLACIDNPNGADNYVFELFSEPLEMSSNWMRVSAGGGLPAGQFDLTGMPGFVDGLLSGSQVEFSAIVDGSAEFIFSDRTLVIKHLNWNKPFDLYVDGQPTSLSWTDNHSQRIHMVLPSTFEVIQTGGRGTIYPVETANGLVLSVADEDKGSDLYSWKIVAIPEPVASAEHIIALEVDGRSEMVFTWAPGRFTESTILLINHLSWAKPSNLIIDETPINLVWEGNTSQPIFFPLAGEYWIRKSQGRDGGYAVQTSDSFLLACIDNPNGTDNYVFELHSNPLQISSEWMRIDVSGGLPIGCFDLTGLPGFVDGFAYGSEIAFSAMIDGSEEFIFSDGYLVIKHLNWRKPSDFYIDGQSVPLSWTDNYSQQIPITLPNTFDVIQTGGRGTIYPVETANGLLLSVADEIHEADSYSWKIVAGFETPHE
jgi:hypothetical protein